MAGFLMPIIVKTLARQSINTIKVVPIAAKMLIIQKAIVPIDQTNKISKRVKNPHPLPLLLTWFMIHTINQINSRKINDQFLLG
jgi:hypothetical protein